MKKNIELDKYYAIFHHEYCLEIVKQAIRENIKYLITGNFKNEIYVYNDFSIPFNQNYIKGNNFLNNFRFKNPDLKLAQVKWLCFSNNFPDYVYKYQGENATSTNDSMKYLLENKDAIGEVGFMCRNGDRITSRFTNFQYIQCYNCYSANIAANLNYSTYISIHRIFVAKVYKNSDEIKNEIGEAKLPTNECIKLIYREKSEIFKTIKERLEYSFKIYANNKRDARYYLTTSGERSLFVLGLQPLSIDDKNDILLSRVIDIVAHNDIYFDSLCLINIYPLIKSQKNIIVDKKLLVDNLDSIMFYLRRIKDPNILLSFGDDINSQNFYFQCLKILYDRICEKLGEGSVHWYHLGNKTKKGNPRSILSIPQSFTFEYFDINEYLSNQITLSSFII